LSAFRRGGRERQLPAEQAVASIDAELSPALISVVLRRAAASSLNSSTRAIREPSRVTRFQSFIAVSAPLPVPRMWIRDASRALVADGAHARADAYVSLATVRSGHAH
jgi:hypothetical protein